MKRNLENPHTRKFRNEEKCDRRLERLRTSNWPKTVIQTVRNNRILASEDEDLTEVVRIND